MFHLFIFNIKKNIFTNKYVSDPLIGGPDLALIRSIWLILP